MAGVGSEMWRKDALYDIMDGKSSQLAGMIAQDPELKKWKCKQAGDECVRRENSQHFKVSSILRTLPRSSAVL